MDSRHALHDILVDRALAQPSAVALLAPGRAPLRYGELAEQVRRIGRWLAAEGIERGDRIAVTLPHGPEMGVATLGVATYATCAPLNPGLSEREFRAAFDELRIGWLVLSAASATSARRAADAAGVRCIDAIFDDARPAGAFELATGASATAPPAAAHDEVAVLLRTSGTTSTPKRVPLTHAQLCLSASNVAAALQLTRVDRCLNILPLFHVHGLVAALLASLHVGASVVCTPGLQDERFIAWLREFEPTWYTAVPTMHQAILREIERLPRDARRNRLRFARSSSAALPPSVGARLEAALGVPVVEAYGMTEAAHQIASNPLPPLPRVPGSAGVAAGPTVGIMDAAGNLLATRAVGEIVIRGVSVIAGYETAPATDATAFINGWFRTGDLGSLDENGYLRLTGRLTELIHRGGEKISPHEIEDALLEHGSVRECVVFAVPHSTLGEDVTAAVVLAPDAGVEAETLRRSLF
ncbi:MAG TPA: AMP-binding protein, partial [Casimicrobiaceae bacterium]